MKQPMHCLYFFFGIPVFVIPYRIMNIDDQLYDIVAKEMRAESLVEGLYTRAFAEADGDKEKAKARYIKLRVQQLRQEYDTRVSQAKEEHDASIRAEKVKQAEERENDWEKITGHYKKYDSWDESAGESDEKDGTQIVTMTIIIIILVFLASTYL